MHSVINLNLGELEVAELVCRQVMQATRRLGGKDSASYLDCVILMVHVCEVKEDFELATAYRKLAQQEICPFITYDNFAPSWTQTPVSKGIASSFSAADATEPDKNQEHFFTSLVPSLGGAREVKHASSFAQRTEVNTNSDARSTTAKHNPRTFLSARNPAQVQILRSFPKEQRPVIRTPEETELESQATGNIGRLTTSKRSNPPLSGNDVKSYYQERRVAYIPNRIIKGGLLKNTLFLLINERFGSWLSDRSHETFAEAVAILKHEPMYQFRTKAFQPQQVISRAITFGDDKVVWAFLYRYRGVIKQGGGSVLTWEENR